MAIRSGVSFYNQHPILLVGFAISLASVTGCDSKTPNSAPPASGTSADAGLPAATPTESTLVGDININGSSTVQPISNAIREAFIKVHPGVNVTVGGEGTGNGFKEFAHKSTDISDASRPI